MHRDHDRANRCGSGGDAKSIHLLDYWPDVVRVGVKVATFDPGAITLAREIAAPGRTTDAQDHFFAATVVRNTCAPFCSMPVEHRTCGPLEAGGELWYIDSGARPVVLRARHRSLH